MTIVGTSACGRGDGPNAPAPAASAPPIAGPGAIRAAQNDRLPSVVVAICLPNTHVTALEPVHKKHAFLRTAARELALPNFEALALRLDDHPITDYDAATSRATFDLREWLLAGSAHVRPGGLALGFEAIPRDDLPPATQRHSYLLGGKPRAIVTLRQG